jgi:NTP pyrophosphatase (non-canonical NTP hydrolase)
MRDNSAFVKVLKQKKLPAALTYIEQASLPVSTEMVIELMDKENVAGVSFSPAKRKWRAYLHQGKKQVFHGYYDTKSEAIAARVIAVTELERIGSTRKVYPAFERTIKPPKYRDLARSLEHLSEEAAEVIHVKSKIIRFGLKDRMKGQDLTNQERLGREVGNMLAMVELLIMSGDVRPADIEDGMKLKVENLKTMY